MRAQLYIIITIGFIRCTESNSEVSSNRTNSETSLSAEKLSASTSSESQEMLEAHIFNEGNYQFETGYVKYDEEKYGFENPGYLNVKRAGKILFTDSFKGEGEVYIKSLGQHNLSGNKLFFTLNYGTEACDYISTSKYYVMIDDKRIKHLGDFISQSGGDGYASRFYDHIFPEDSCGKLNTLLIVEGLMFHEHDQPDLYDTTKITFDNSTFVIRKETNNLEKAK